MDYNIQFIGFIEKDLSLPNPYDTNQESIDIEIKPLVRYAIKEKVINVQIEVLYLQDTNIILNYGVSISYSIDNEFMVSSKIDNKLIAKLMDISMGFTRGAMATYIKNTHLKGLILPVVNINELCERIVFIPIEKNQ